MKKRSACIILLLLMFMPYFSPYAAAQSWIGDFDKICAQAEVADSLPTATLKELTLESDRLLAVIEASNDPQEKSLYFQTQKMPQLVRVHNGPERGERKVCAPIRGSQIAASADFAGPYGR